MHRNEVSLLASQQKLVVCWRFLGATTAKKFLRQDPAMNMLPSPVGGLVVAKELQFSLGTVEQED